MQSSVEYPERWVIAVKAQMNYSQKPQALSHTLSLTKQVLLLVGVLLLFSTEASLLYRIWNKGFTKILFDPAKLVTVYDQPGNLYFWQEQNNAIKGDSIQVTDEKSNEQTVYILKRESKSGYAGFGVKLNISSTLRNCLNFKIRNLSERINFGIVIQESKTPTNPIPEGWSTYSSVESNTWQDFSIPLDYFRLDPYNQPEGKKGNEKFDVQALDVLVFSFPPESSIDLQLGKVELRDSGSFLPLLGLMLGLQVWCWILIRVGKVNGKQIVIEGLLSHWLKLAIYLISILFAVYQPALIHDRQHESYQFLFYLILFAVFEAYVVIFKNFDSRLKYGLTILSPLVVPIILVFIPGAWPLALILIAANCFPLIELIENKGILAGFIYWAGSVSFISIIVYPIPIYTYAVLSALIILVYIALLHTILSKYSVETYQLIDRYQTERNTALVSLHSSEKKIQAILDNVAEGIITVDSDGVIESFNLVSEQIFGYEADEVIGCSVKILIPESERVKHDFHISEYLNVDRSKMHIAGQETVGQRKSGEVFPIELAVSEINIEGTITYIGLIRDISEKKHIEERLRQSHKMEAIGQLAGGIAHDFNNLLTGIIGNLSIASRKAPGNIAKNISVAKDAAERAADLVQNLLTFSRKTKVELKPVDLNQIIEDVYNLTRKIIDRRIEIKRSTDPALPKVFGDASQINSILMNLCVNARDAFDDILFGDYDHEQRGSQFIIAMKSEMITIDAEYCKNHLDARTGSYAVLSITDNGIGMDSNVVIHIFEPFYTTKDVGKGTGLGLASAYGIVKQHQGWIDVHSEPGKGTTFSVFLPIQETGQIPVQETIEDDRTFDGSETILFVEDEEIIRNLNRITAESHGYKVFSASDGQKGLDLYRRHNNEIDLIVLDLSMPNLSGPELLYSLYAENYHPKIIVCSGFMNGSLDKLDQYDIAAFVQKPYEPRHLIQIIRDTLDQL